MVANEHILGLDRAELAALMNQRFELPPFRARQLIRWLHKKGVRSFDEMTDIAAPLREQFAEEFAIFRPEIVSRQVSRDGTQKFLFRLEDGCEIESVLIKQPTRYTLCVSSQVGCAMGCSFCRTALMKLRRNLETHEIVGQVLAAREAAGLDAESGEPISFFNIVFMGMGEPLHNYENVSRALRLLNDELGHNFSPRKVTVSTSGLVPAICRYGEDALPASLAVSLNATTDEVRDQLIPINRKYPLRVLLNTLRELPLKPGRRITIEYVMLHGVNDRAEDLDRLPGLLRGIPVKVNLIPYNENAGLGYRTPPRDHIMAWQDQLLSHGLNTTIRWSKGEDISAACGQLATESARPRRERHADHAVT
ncbi:MAG: 23S rRNA (adenine(2503)-C(2))-methyltransferase RlmN [Bdellovibrionales bacterium]|nr:23S rRNA (adenine(2503)-C(2))-methyltransferase RlmN [Bdellovibrionales bacterium]